MRTGTASRTAQAVALRRAKHQLVDRPLVFNDPLAVRITGNEAAAQLSMAEGFASSPLRAFLAARSRYAEDELAAGIANGVRQYVVLGAGLDTFAYRNPYATAVRVFEVDHPDTQAWKLQRLRETDIAIPDSATWVPVDFEKQNLAERLLCAEGFDKNLPTFFSWLGVTVYLTEDAFVKTLRLIASMPAGSGVVFDYGLARALLSFGERVALGILSRRVALAGEPFRLFFTPERLAEILCEIGFRRFEDLGQREINARYFQNRRDGLAVRGLARLLSAWT